MKIEIDVDLADLGMLRLRTAAPIDKKILEAYEAEKNKIQVGDWFLLTHSKIIRRWTDFDDKGHSGADAHCTKRSGSCGVPSKKVSATGPPGYAAEGRPRRRRRSRVST